MLASDEETLCAAMRPDRCVGLCYARVTDVHWSSKRSNVRLVCASVSASFAGRFQGSSGVNMEQAEGRCTLQISDNMDETVCLFFAVCALMNQNLLVHLPKS